jgi:hypothetical protein
MRHRLLTAFLAISTTAAVAAAGTPATASATPTYRLLQAGPLTVHAYKMYILAAPGYQGAPGELFVSFDRGTAADQQQHYYSFSKGVQVKVSKNGGSASIKADLGSFGSIRLNFSPGGSHVEIPAACSGAVVSQQYGTLSGPHSTAFDLISHSTYFNTVTAGSLHAVITTIRGNEADCHHVPAALPTGVTQLITTSVNTTSDLVVSFIATRTAAGTVTENLSDTDSSYNQSAGVVIVHSVTVSSLPAGDLTNTTDLSTASSAAGGSFLTGTLAYAGTNPLTQGQGTLGTASGGLSANFDGVGAVPAASGALTSATLQVGT